MVGMPGRSGKINTPEARERRREAAAKGSAAARASRGGGPLTEPEEGDDATDKEPARALTDDEILRLLPGSNPYDAVVLKSRNRFTYLDGKTREQVRGVELENQKRDADLQQARGKLLSFEAVEEIQERDDAIILGHLNEFPQFVGTLMPPERATEARAKAGAWLDEIRAKIDADLRAARE